MVFCNRCGCYSSIKAVGIKLPCSKGEGKATILRRLRKGIHPVSLGKMKGTQKVPSQLLVKRLAYRCGMAGGVWVGGDVPRPTHTGASTDARRRIRCKTKPNIGADAMMQCPHDDHQPDSFPEVGCGQGDEEDDLGGWLDEVSDQEPEYWEA